jgi:hypothetical protein
MASRARAGWLRGAGRAGYLPGGVAVRGEGERDCGSRACGGERKEQSSYGGGGHGEAWSTDDKAVTVGDGSVHPS